MISIRQILTRHNLQFQLLKYPNTHKIKHWFVFQTLWHGRNQNQSKKSKAINNKETKTQSNNLIHRNRVENHLQIKVKRRKPMSDLLKKIII